MRTGAGLHAHSQPNLCRDEAVAHYAQLLADAGYGRRPFERAGFLIRENDGTLTFAPWPGSDFARVQYRGGIPANTIAVVHTHPQSASSRPSAHDLAEARRLRLPVLVVTPTAVTMAGPDGRVGAVMAGRQWFKEHN